MSSTTRPASRLHTKWSARLAKIPLSRFYSHGEANLEGSSLQQTQGVPDARVSLRQEDGQLFGLCQKAGEGIVWEACLA